MNAAALIRQINRELRDWDGEGPEVSWTKNGLQRALTIVRTQAKLEQIKAQERRPRLSRWIAGELYRAIAQSLDYLKRGDRAKAITMLETARSAADATRKEVRA